MRIAMRSGWQGTARAATPAISNTRTWCTDLWQRLFSERGLPDFLRHGEYLLIYVEQENRAPHFARARVDTCRWAALGAKFLAYRCNGSGTGSHRSALRSQFFSR